MTSSPKTQARNTLRHKLFLVLESGRASGTPGLIFEAGLIGLIIANVAAVALETIPAIHAAYSGLFKTFEIFSLVIFTIEYVLRLWTAPEDPRVAAQGPLVGRLRYVVHPVMVIDFLAFAPSYIALFVPFADLRILRLFRLVRLLKVARYSPALTSLVHVIISERRALFGTLILLLCVMCFSATAMYFAEGHVQPEEFGSIPDCMWWAITTLTTVGYGDAVPITPLGKFIAGVTMIFGLGFFALPVAIIATSFVNEIHRRDFVVTWSMLSRMPLFEGFDNETIGEVMNVLRSHVVSADAQIATAGQQPSEMYFIVSGEAEAEKPSGAEKLGPGDFFGEAALLHTRPHDATVTARTHCRVLALSAEDFNALLRRFPELRQRIEQLAAQRSNA